MEPEKMNKSSEKIYQAVTKPSIDKLLPATEEMEQLEHSSGSGRRGIVNRTSLETKPT
jgi:hypothetical protein